MKRRFVPSGHPATALDKAAFTLALVLLFKFLLFDLCWSIPTTFKPFSTLEFYLTKLIAVLLLLAPFKLFRLWKTQLGLMLLLDGLLINGLIGLLLIVALLIVALLVIGLLISGLLVSRLLVAGLRVGGRRVLIQRRAAVRAEAFGVADVLSAIRTKHGDSSLSLVL